MSDTRFESHASRDEAQGPSTASAILEPLRAHTSGAASMAELLPVLAPVIKGVAAAVGPHCEVVLHDLAHHQMDHTIIAIENGHVTGRSVGGPSTNLGLEMLRSEAEDHDEYGYRSRTADGRELSSSSVYFRDPQGHVIGSLCLNVDLTPVQRARNALEELTPPEDRHPVDREETFASDINEVLEELIEAAIEQTGKSVGLMDREDKLEVLRFLDQKGAFYVKRAMDRIASRLGMSRVTAYNYLDKARSRRGESPS